MTIFVGKVEFGVECDAVIVIFQEAKFFLITRADANNVSGEHVVVAIVLV